MSNLCSGHIQVSVLIRTLGITVTLALSAAMQQTYN